LLSTHQLCSLLCQHSSDTIFDLCCVSCLCLLDDAFWRCAFQRPQDQQQVRGILPWCFQPACMSSHCMWSSCCTTCCSSFGYHWMFQRCTGLLSRMSSSHAYHCCCCSLPLYLSCCCCCCLCCCFLLLFPALLSSCAMYVVPIGCNITRRAFVFVSMCLSCWH
jgi:hypothetical protein